MQCTALTCRRHTQALTRGTVASAQCLQEGGKEGESGIAGPGDKRKNREVVEKNADKEKDQGKG